MSDSQNEMDVDDAPGPAGDSVTQQISEESTSSSSTGTNIVVTGGKFKGTHFGPKYEVHHHYHYPDRDNGGNQGDQPGTSQVRREQPQGENKACPIPDTKDNGERIVPPQTQHEVAGNPAKLTDTITVYMAKPICKRASVYPGVQHMGEFCSDRPLAVKIVPPHKKRKREAKNLVKLTPHSNVVLVVHADTLPGAQIMKNIYIAMEQCQTLTLEEYIENRVKEKVPFNTRQALDFAKQIIRGMSHIHSMDIVHRDLKPSSVLFSLDGTSLKIIDFGVSKELENGLTTMSVSTRIGTDGYRAPETYKAKDSRHMKKSADIFSLGVLLCHIWSYGRHPFGEDGTLWAHNIKKGIAPNFSQLLIPDLEKARTLLRAMLQVEEAKRSTVTDVLNHAYICQGIDNTLLTEMDQVWAGQVKVRDDDDAVPFDCRMFERMGNNFLELREASPQFQLLYVPLTRMTPTLDGMTYVPPNGYIAVSKCVFLKRLKKKFDKKMGWLNAYKNKERIGSFIIFQPKGYEELVGIFIQNPEEFLNRLRVASVDKNIPEEPVDADDSEPSEQVEMEEQVTAAPVFQPTADDVPQQSQPFQEATEVASPNHDLLRAIKGDMDDRPQVAEEEQEEENIPDEEPEVNREVEIGQPEYISWWLYKPAASEQAQTVN